MLMFLNFNVFLGFRGPIPFFGFILGLDAFYLQDFYRWRLTFQNTYLLTGSVFLVATAVHPTVYKEGGRIKKEQKELILPT